MKQAKIENYSGIKIASLKLIPPLRRNRHFFVNVPIGGDAPKDFVKVYRYGECYAEKRSTWPAFIAKVGHKWYPNESITEHLLTRVGQSFGMRVADSCLMRIDGQIRFLSRYFLKSGQSLIHGAQIFSGHLEDPDFVQTVVDERRSHELFTFQFIEQAIRTQFPEGSDKLLIDFLRLLAYDAIIGNNDRHHLNWGVIQKSLSNTQLVEFSPVYDTARALFWNHNDDRICSVVNNHHYKTIFLNRYIKGSKPKTGWDGEDKINHFQLISKIAESFPNYKPVLIDMSNRVSIAKVKELLDKEFKLLMIPERRDLIVECLSMRLERFNQILGKEV